SDAGGADASIEGSADGSGSADSGGTGGSDAGTNDASDAGVGDSSDAAVESASNDGGSGDSGGEASTPIAVTLCPKVTVLLPGESMHFSADVTGAGPAVYYGIVGGTSGGGSDSGSVDRGTITSAGIYTAPAAPGTYQVVAKSQSDTTK